MRQKVLAMMMVLVLGVSVFFGNNLPVQAEDLGEDMDFSYLLTDSALVGYAEAQTWGLYLMSGRSIINKISSTKIGAGGTTTASMVCEVSLCCIVERQTDTGWARVTSWSQINESDISVMISKSLTVGTGYYYRVRSLHTAASDASSSCTSALKM